MDDLRTKMGGRVSLRRVSEGAEKHIGKHARIDSMSCEMPALQASFSVDSKHGRHNGEPEASCAGSGVLSGVEGKKSRNESFDCMRLIAFCGVIFLHLNATVDMETNALMGSINSVVRFAVPYFFALTGFFICRADPYGMGRGFRKEIVFVGCAVLAYLVASYFGVWHWQGIGTSTPAMQFFQSDWIPAFLKWNSFGFAYHLWFLFALLYGYAILILWRSCKFPIPLFAFLGMAMMVIRMYLYEFGGVEDPLSDPASSFVFLGFPSFAFGMVLSYASKWISKIPSPVSLVIIVFGGLAVYMGSSELRLAGNICWVPRDGSRSFLVMLKMPSSIQQGSRIAAHQSAGCIWRHACRNCVHRPSCGSPIAAYALPHRSTCGGYRYSSDCLGGMRYRFDRSRIYRVSCYFDSEVGR